MDDARIIAAFTTPIIAGLWVAWTRRRDRLRAERGELPPPPIETPPLRDTPDNDVVSWLFRGRGRMKGPDYYAHVSVLEPLPLLSHDGSRELPSSDAGAGGESGQGSEGVGRS